MISITLGEVVWINNILSKDNNNKSLERPLWYGTQRSQLSSLWLMMMIRTHHSIFGILEIQITQLQLSLISITMEFYQPHGALLIQIWLSHLLRTLEQLL